MDYIHTIEPACLCGFSLLHIMCVCVCVCVYVHFLRLMYEFAVILNRQCLYFLFPPVFSGVWRLLTFRNPINAFPPRWLRIHTSHFIFCDISKSQIEIVCACVPLVKHSSGAKDKAVSPRILELKHFNNVNNYHRSYTNTKCIININEF